MVCADQTVLVHLQRARTELFFAVTGADLCQRDAAVREQKPVFRRAVKLAGGKLFPLPVIPFGQVGKGLFGREESGFGVFQVQPAVTENPVAFGVEAADAAAARAEIKCAFQALGQYRVQSGR